MARLIRPPFDIGKDFIVNKPFKFGGQDNTPGETFRWRHLNCDPRDLYRFYEQRLLECKSEENIEGVNGPSIEDEVIEDEVKTHVYIPPNVNLPVKKSEKGPNVTRVTVNKNKME